jgi:hypothetical protein
VTNALVASHDAVSLIRIAGEMTEQVCNRTGWFVPRLATGEACNLSGKSSRTDRSRWLRLTLVCGVLIGFSSGRTFALEVPQSVFLKCAPPLDRSDLDPVTETWIYAKFDGKRNYEALTMTVVHRSKSGNAYYRMYQYDASFQSDALTYTWSWSGTLKANQRYKMTGTLTYNGTWSYHEAQMLDGNPSMSTEFNCRTP